MVSENTGGAMTGTVKSFSPAKGYGFIVSKQGEYWFHISEWMGKERPNLGDSVDFFPATTGKGQRAYIVSKEIKDGERSTGQIQRSVKR